MSKPPFSFAEDGNAFVIYDPILPKQWCNYLWSQQGYVARVTHVGSGESYSIDEKANFCSLNKNEVRFLYFRDEETNVCWNAGLGPLMEPVEKYQCTHRISHTEIRSEKNGIAASVRYFVPDEGFHEIWTVTLKNSSPRPRNLSVFAVVNFDLEGFQYPRYHEMDRTLHAFYDEKLNGVFCRSAHHWAPHTRYNAFLACSEKITGYDANVKRFTGALGGYHRPQMLLDGNHCTGSSRSGYDLGGVLQNKLQLQPGEERVIHYICGQEESLGSAVQRAGAVFKPGCIETLLTDTHRKMMERYGSLSVASPDEKINMIMNNWLKKQVDFCIVGKKGVRDNAQIASALLMYRPEKARREILEILRHQYRSGNAVLTWLPVDETRYSDQAFWIIWIITELIKETGDFSVLEEKLEYQDGGEGTVFEHMKAAVQRLLDDRGKNGLVKIFFADWNDALNVSDDPEAESVMLTQQFCLALEEFSVLCDKIGNKDYSAFLRDKYQEVKEAVNRHAWDGQWYARVLSDKGNIGSKDSEGSTIYLNPQVWGVLAGLADGQRLKQVLKAVDSMEHDFGFPINKPPYTSYSPHVGRIGLMLNGLYENGGVYCHASAFKVMMDGKVGRGDEALRTLKKIMPNSEKNPYTQSETEPYVFTNCYSINPHSYGKADRSWITGTSAWCMKGLYEGILGIYKDYDGLRIQPSLPSGWSQVQATRTFRNTQYRISMKKDPALQSGKLCIAIDGNTIGGNILPVFADNKIHQVDVKIGV
jgi:cellobiose phosphorylase